MSQYGPQASVLKRAFGGIQQLEGHRKLIRDLLNSKDYSDLTITCGDQKLHVHKNVVCSRCSWFKEKAGDSSVKVIDMSDEDIRALRAMISYLYTLAFPEYDFTPLLQIWEKDAPSWMSSDRDKYVNLPHGKSRDFIATKLWTYDLAVYRIASKYGVKDLQNLATENVKALPDSMLTNLKENSKQLNSPARRSQRYGWDCINRDTFFTTFNEGFAELIRQLYTDESIEARKEMRNAIIKNYGQEIGRKAYLGTFEKMMREIPDLAVDLAVGLARKVRKSGANT